MNEGTASVDWPDMSRIYANSVKAEESIKGSVKRDRDDGNLISVSVDDSYTTLDGLSSYNTFSFVGDSTAPPSVTTDCEEDVDDDELMSWVASGMLPVNTSTTLALNQAYQEVLQQFIGRISGILAQVRERKKSVQKMIDDTYVGDPKARGALKVPSLVYICPYFRDSAGLCPGLNKEARQIHSGAFFDMLLFPKPKWSKKEISSLQKGVAETTMQALLSPLLNKREVLKERSLSDDIKLVDAVKVEETIKDLDKQTAKLKCLSKTDLYFKYSEVQLDWSEISITHMNSVRTPDECRLFWKNDLLPSLIGSSSADWTQDELINLKNLTEEMNCTNWVKIAETLGTGRTAFQCFEQYQMSLNDNLIKTGWTVEEEEKLKEVVDQVRIGNYIPWHLVPFFVDGKTRDQCCRHYKQCLDNRFRRGKWCEDEDLLLMKAVEIYGAKDWSRVADFVQTRNDIQCRERWCLTLNSRYVCRSWSKSEDATLLLGASTFGVGRWSKIAQLLPGRNPHHCKTRYKSLKEKNGQKGQQAITINLVDDEPRYSRAKNNRASQLRSFFESRKTRVKNFYVQEYGSLPPSAPSTAEASTLLRSLPESIRILVRDKLNLIQNLYGRQAQSLDHKRRKVDQS